MTEHDGEIHDPQLKVKSRFLPHWELPNLYIHHSDLSCWYMHAPQIPWNEEQFLFLGNYSFLGGIVITGNTVYKIDLLPISYCLWITDARQWGPTLETVNKGVRQVWVLLGYLSPGKASKPSLPWFSNGGIKAIACGHVVRIPGFMHSNNSPLLIVVSVTCIFTS